MFRHKMQGINWSYQRTFNHVRNISLKLAMSLEYQEDWLYWLEYGKVNSN
jgi:hypothetical protein